MTEEQSKSSKLKRRLAVLGIVVVGLMSTAFVVWSATCPCERSPGGYLFGAGLQAVLQITIVAFRLFPQDGKDGSNAYVDIDVGGAI